MSVCFIIFCCRKYESDSRNFTNEFINSANYHLFSEILRANKYNVVPAKMPPSKITGPASRMPNVDVSNKRPGDCRKDHPRSTNGREIEYRTEKIANAPVATSIPATIDWLTVEIFAGFRIRPPQMPPASAAAAVGRPM